MTGELYVGLISGTSMDGIDAAVVELSEGTARLLAARTFPFPASVEAVLDQVRGDPDHFSSAELARLDARLGDLLGDAALAVIDQANQRARDIRAIGSHGQTILHRIDADPPHTLQIGDPFRIAERTGITTVADFRRADVAAGGQGAPLAPLIHQALLGHSEQSRVVVNLGGIANLTRLAPNAALSGFDTGPANCFLDLWFRRHRPGRYDQNGAWAASGQVDDAWLRTLLDDPYFCLAPPKSTGIEYFSSRWLDKRLPPWANDRPQDIQATLAEFSAHSLAAALLAQGQPDRIILCGGGVHNQDLLERLGRHLPAITISASDEYGLPADYVEATLFAWLARERLNQRPIATSSITGARHPVALGVIVHASAR